MPNFGMMTAGHFLYIPAAMLVGLLIGYMLGARAMKSELERRQKRMKE